MSDKFVAMDLGNCCIWVNSDECLRRLGLNSIAEVPKDFLNKCAELECGLISTKEWLCEFRKITNDKFTDKELIEIWNSIIGEEIKGMSQIIEEIISRNIKVALLSDTSELHLNYAISKLSFAKKLCGGVYSFIVGERKPSLKMYKVFEKKFAFPLIYTDDKEENIEAAMSIGWNSHLFKNPEDFFSAFLKATGEKRWI
ncbi:MAG TPA: hypothetical protein PLN24_09875 [Victivallales bacterium]|nr:hypothetical protein [Victivallales bacterium]HPO90858.1 hypothetical protein [Victivallales bacterium]